MDELAEKVRRDEKCRPYVDFIKEVPRMGLPFITDFLHFAKCLRRRLANYSLWAVPGSPPAAAREIADTLNIAHCLTRIQPDAQLKDALAMNMFTLSNLITLLEQGHVNAVLFFMPIVLWRVAIQAINITRDSRVRLLAAAFDVVRLCDAQLHSSGLNEKGRRGSDSPLFLYRHIDMSKMMTSLIVLGFVLMLPIDQINLSRIGTAALEHLFGVTRLGTNGSDSADRIRRLLARSFMVKKTAEKRGVSLGAKSKRNLAGTIDDLTKEGLITIPYLEMPELHRSVGAELCSFFLDGKCSDRVRLALDTCRARFSQLSQLIIDGQKEIRDTALGGFSVLPRMTAVAANQKRKKDLNEGGSVHVMKLTSTKTRKSYYLMVYGGETIADVKSMLKSKYHVSARDIFLKDSPGNVLDDDEILAELDLSLTYDFREQNKVERENERRFAPKP
jgi:hypothetical protein